MVADNPEQKISLKMFHSTIQNDHDAIANEEASFRSIPVITKVTDEDIRENYHKVKEDIQNLLFFELALLKAKNDTEQDESVKRGINETLSSDHMESNEEQGESMSM